MGRTPLHYAAASTNGEFYDELVKAGASEDAKDCVSHPNKTHPSATKILIICFEKNIFSENAILCDVISTKHCLQTQLFVLLQKNLNPQDYRTEMVSAGSSGVEGLAIEGMLAEERNAKYAQKIYLKLQYQQFKAAVEKKDLEGECVGRDENGIWILAW